MDAMVKVSANLESDKLFAADHGPSRQGRERRSMTHGPALGPHPAHLGKSQVDCTPFAVAVHTMVLLCYIRQVIVVILHSTMYGLWNRSPEDAIGDMARNREVNSDAFSRTIPRQSFQLTFPTLTIEAHDLHFIPSCSMI